MTVTRSPRATRASTRLDPMKPAPPVTTQSMTLQVTFRGHGRHLSWV